MIQGLQALGMEDLISDSFISVTVLIEEQTCNSALDLF